MTHRPLPATRSAIRSAARPPDPDPRRAPSAERIRLALTLSRGLAEAARGRRGVAVTRLAGEGPPPAR